MSEKKTPESEWEEAERLGPYRLHEQVSGDAHSSGELFRATHEESGATALVLKPAEDPADPVSLSNWQVNCTSSGAPAYMSMEVASSPWSHGTDKHSVEELLFMHEGLRDGVERMARVLSSGSSGPERRPGGWQGWTVAGAVAVCALLCLLVLQSRPPSSVLTPAEEMTSAPMSDDVSTGAADAFNDHFLLRGAVEEQPPGIADPFPRQPYKGQNRPPCIPKVEEEILGGCWVPHQLKAPCPSPLREYKGKCYSVSMAPPKTPQSIQP